MKTTTYNVPGIRCEGCASAIVKALSALEPVATVDVNVTAKAVDVTFDESRIGDEGIRGVLAAAGFPAR